MAGHWPRLLRPYWVPRVPRYQGYQGYQGYQESGSGMGVSGSLPDLPDSTQTSSCGTFIILVTSASSSLRNGPVAPLVHASETTGWAKPLPSSVRPRLAKVSGL